jgi:hypothetical protein
MGQWDARAMRPCFPPFCLVGPSVSSFPMVTLNPRTSCAQRKKEHENKYAPFAKSRTPTLKVRFVVEYEYGVLQDKRESKF